MEERDRPRRVNKARLIEGVSDATAPRQSSKARLADENDDDRDDLPPQRELMKGQIIQGLAVIGVLFAAFVAFLVVKPFEAEILNWLRLVAPIGAGVIVALLSSTPTAATLQRSMWGGLAAWSAFCFLRYEALLQRRDNTVMQEISISGIFLVEILIAFVVVFSLCQVMKLWAAKE